MQIGTASNVWHAPTGGHLTRTDRLSSERAWHTETAGARSDPAVQA